MRYFVLDEDDRKKIDGRPDFILKPVSDADEARHKDCDENDLYQREYIVFCSWYETSSDRSEGYVTAPILYKSEKYLGFFSEEAWEKVLNDIKHVEPSQARKLTRYFVQCAELLEKSETSGKYSLSLHTLNFVGYADYPGQLRGYQIADGVFVLTKGEDDHCL